MYEWIKAIKGALPIWREFKWCIKGTVSEYYAKQCNLKAVSMKVDLTPKCVAAIAARGVREQNFMKLVQQIN